MGTKLPPDQLELYRGIDEILWKDWDPIGVSAFPDARDEYQAYLPKVFALAIEGSSALSIAEYLHFVATERMGLESRTEGHALAAEKIVRLRHGILRGAQ